MFIKDRVNLQLWNREPRHFSSCRREIGRCSLAKFRSRPFWCRRGGHRRTPPQSAHPTHCRVWAAWKGVGSPRRPLPWSRSGLVTSTRSCLSKRATLLDGWSEIGRRMHFGRNKCYYFWVKYYQYFNVIYTIYQFFQKMAFNPEWWGFLPARDPLSTRTKATAITFNRLHFVESAEGIVLLFGVRLEESPAHHSHVIGVGNQLNHLLQVTEMCVCGVSM